MRVRIADIVVFQGLYGVRPVHKNSCVSMLKAGLENPWKYYGVQGLGLDT